MGLILAALGGLCVGIAVTLMEIESEGRQTAIVVLLILAMFLIKHS